ncbi:TonB-dependent receptor [Cellulophaga sp. E16_2]|uniref:TonB-dependent receptor n=1 Tax=Cellulophaga algicola (strain DSM 14237 / IC166 / ACAM 630) TaxID=688270 RepID=E6XFH7_CELAD|nr:MULTISPECIES: TonB-dependent receptor [Cellulophaga]ADV51450.1 TonB-dependent receptor [Cellulophaga algicola DSM 14237]MBO0593823.1 TonB-dependent receptor [Cellulophaga sp. E16_2]
MNKIYFSLLLAMLNSFVYAQNSLKGTIKEAGTNLPLEQVSIYFPQLEKGSVTAANGSYEILNLPSGNFKIVVSYIGYQTISKAILIDGKQIINDFTLQESAIEMEEVIISTPFHKLQSENVMKVEYANIKDLKNKGSITLADGISTIPGVESVSTGIGIGKPVIRGLNANRVLVYTQGIRLENQQFGDEHGLGVNDAGIESVEVIKGPASLLYGSDAMGGVLYLNPEKFAFPNSTESDVNLNYFTNTQGISANAGVKTATDNFRFLLRGAITSHTDYKTGNNERVTNSRFKEYDIKSGIGYQITNFKTEVRYNYNNSNLGIPEEIGEQSTNRTPIKPNQTIDNHILSSKSSLLFNASILDVTLGYTSNIRKEFEEDEEGAALHMNLNTFNYNIQYHAPKYGILETILGAQGLHQNNSNFGEELLVPDATTNDIGFFGTSHLHFNEFNDIQVGLRYDHRTIKGDANGTLGEEGYIAALNRDFSSFNAALGYKANFATNFVARLNLATGFRAPNLAELTSNGVHEGTNRYEIGNANLKNEQNIQTDVALEYKNEHFEIYANGFYNSINDYVFIAPTGDEIEGNQVFAYNQQNANLYGGEAGIHIHPHPLDWLHFESSFQTVRGKLKDGDNLPLIPANSITNTLRGEFNKRSGGINSGYTFITLKSVFEQDQISLFETTTDGYSLLSIGLGGTITIFNSPMDLRISGNNLLDKNYVSHLSRLKYDGITNIGRNISLGISVPL